MAKHTLLCSLLALLLISFNHAANAQAGGTITLLNKEGDKCALSVPGPGTGVTQQFNLTAHGSATKCKDWKVRSIVLTDLPSAARIYMTDDPWCTPGKGEHAITVRTAINPTTSTDPSTPWEIIDLYAVAPGQMITPGLQLINKRMEQGANPRDSVKCIEVTTSGNIDTPELTPTIHGGISRHEVDVNDSPFSCPKDEVIIVRIRNDWELGRKIFYWCAPLRQGGNEVTLSDEIESAPISESGGHYFSCPANTVMTGRDHDGGVDGNTRYRCATPKVNGHALTVTPMGWSDTQREDDSAFSCQPFGRVMVGHWHQGLYSGPSRVRCATVQ
ncbi:hypothetical protein [Pseudomonas putida]|uniref:hypothetical protein n=1 Tax=Pseudomonas putida TaxID=303 RepID=UPI001F525593|nr:hypothetical protein [Pseudomonas putida]MCI0910838.1 hypothetical protein [Pseudomonas putida]